MSEGPDFKTGQEGKRQKTSAKINEEGGQRTGEKKKKYSKGSRLQKK